MGHLNLPDEGSGVLLVGGCLGSLAASWSGAPGQFTADARQAEPSLHLLRTVRGTRMLCAHGAGLGDPWLSLDALPDDLLDALLGD